jgi:hypothetical protein
LLWWLVLPASPQVFAGKMLINVKMQLLTPMPVADSRQKNSWQSGSQSYARGKMNLTAKTRNGRCDTAVATRFSSLITAHSALFTSSAPLFPLNPLFPHLRSGHPLFSTAFTPKANS